MQSSTGAEAFVEREIGFRLASTRVGAAMTAILQPPPRAPDFDALLRDPERIRARLAR